MTGDTKLDQIDFLDLVDAILDRSPRPRKKREPIILETPEEVSTGAGNDTGNDAGASHSQGPSDRAAQAKHTDVPQEDGGSTRKRRRRRRGRGDRPKNADGERNARTDRAPKDAGQEQGGQRNERKKNDDQREGGNRRRRRRRGGRGRGKPNDGAKPKPPGNN